MADLRRWHRTIVTLFFIAGLIGASFMVRLPLVRELLQVNTQQLGLLLLATSVGSLIALTQIGRFISKRGTKPVIVGGFVLFFIAVLFQITFVVNQLPIGYAIASLFVGFAAASSDVGINIDGSAIEKELGKSSLPRMHAAYSIGTLVGAGIGTIASAIDFSFFWQIVILALACLTILLIVIRILPSGVGVEKTKTHETDSAPVVKWLTPTVVLLCLGILGVTLGEGAAIDWLALAVVDDYNESSTMAGIAYGIVMFTMTLTRFFGGNLVDRFGKGATLRVMSLVGVLGILIVIFSPTIYLAWVGAGLWGVGVALGFPLFISAAAEQEHGPKKVAFVTTAGYLAFLVGPPLLGFLGQSWGMLKMFFVIAGFLTMAAIVSFAAGNRKSVDAPVEATI